MRLIKYIEQFKDGGGIKRPKHISDEQWSVALDIYNKAKQAGDRYPELTLAQAALETGWFKKTAGNYNYFGQKAGKGQASVNLNTKEEGANGMYSIKDNFRVYSSLDESINDRMTKWGSKYKDAKDVGQAIDIVLSKGYATDTKYKSKIGSILNTLGFSNDFTNPPSEIKKLSGASQLQNNLSTTSYNIERPDLSGQAYLSAIDDKLNTATEELVKFQEERVQEQKKQETLQQEDVQRQVLQQAQQQKEEIYNLLTANPPESLQYDVSPTQQAFSQIQPFQFQSDFYSGEGLFQEGGQIEFEEKIYELNPALITANDFNTPKQFLQDYINSPNYKQRLINSGYSNVDELVQNRTNDVQGVKLTKIQDKKPGIFKQLFNEITGEPYTTNGSVYNRDGNSVILDKQQAEFLQVPLTDVWTHEIGHSELSSIPLNDYDNNEIEKRLIIDKNANLHASDPEEIKADLNTIRYQLFKKNITDPKTKQINKEDINQLDSSFIKDRLTESVGEENLIWLLNNIAQNTPTQQPITYAKSGGTISPLNKIKKNFQVGGQVLPKLNFNKFQYNSEIEDLPESVIYGEKKKIFSNELEMIPNQTANTFSNMFGNVSTYFFGTEDSELIESPYKPTKSTDNSIKYYIRPGMKEDVYKDLTSEKVKTDYNHTGEFEDIFKALKSNGEDREHNAENSFSKNKVGYKGMYNLGSPGKLNRGQFNFGRYTVDAGEDEKGKYISFYDVYDWNGSKTKNPIPFYGRIYEDEWSDYKNKIKIKQDQEEKKAKKNNENERKTLLLKHKL